ncbi:trehalase-like isoform X2 [Primulina huaijiensis]|uniref:trehalase-like isoform X2 n=1 Tax=Primulina huaijiensis TaxID=1492673 RepID=UPI003CC70BC5
MVMNVYNRTCDYEVVVKSLIDLLKEHKFWNSGMHKVMIQDAEPEPCVVIMQCGISQGQSNQPLTGKRLPSFQIVVREHDFIVNWQLASAVESGWDISTRWMRMICMKQRRKPLHLIQMCQKLIHLWRIMM